MSLTNSTRNMGLVLIALSAATAGVSLGGEPVTTNVKSESFDREPGWEGHRNHIVPKAIPTITQDFGYRSTTFAGATAGEIGGRLHRAAEAAWYGARIAPKTLDDKLSAAGTFAFTASEGAPACSSAGSTASSPAVPGGRWRRWE
jgi:hypothetical protein